MEKDKTNQQDDQKEYSQEIIDLVVARLSAVPSNVYLSVGNQGKYNIAELIKRVKANDEIGKKIIEMQLAYIRSLKGEE